MCDCSVQRLEVLDLSYCLGIKALALSDFAQRPPASLRRLVITGVQGADQGTADYLVLLMRNVVWPDIIWSDNPELQVRAWACARPSRAVSVRAQALSGQLLDEKRRCVSGPSH